MNKVKTLDDLRKMRETLRSTLDIREKSNHPEQMVQIRVSMATCVEVTLPGKEPLVFGHVKKAKVDEIIARYIRHGELLDDIIPVTYTAVKPE